MDWVSSAKAELFFWQFSGDTHKILTIFLYRLNTAIEEPPMEQHKLAEFTRFLQEELALPIAAIHLALRRSDHSLHSLPMILWEYGLVTLSQLEQIFDWLE
jgi:hypothetical protein